MLAPSRRRSAQSTIARVAGTLCNFVGLSRARAGPLEAGFSLVTENEVARIVDPDEQHEVNGRRFGVEPFERWREEIGAAFVPLDAFSNASDGVSRFTGALKSGAVGALPMNEVSGRQVDVHRTRRTIRDSDPGVVKVGLQLRGRGVVVQQEREATLFPGDFALYDTSVPFTLHFDGDFTTFVVTIPRASLKIPSKSLAAVTAVSIPANKGAGSLVSPFLQGLWRGLIAGSPTSARFEDAVIDLVSGALDEETSRALGPSGVGIVSCAKYFIDAHLADPALDTSMVAAAHHISPRYLQKLFEAEGLTVAGWIRTRRLQRCHRDLQDPMLASVGIGLICARHGFADANHFSRLFKQAYGVSPRSLRECLHL
jgi:AraC-like DNA-binding protein